MSKSVFQPIGKNMRLFSQLQSVFATPNVPELSNYIVLQARNG